MPKTTKKYTYSIGRRRSSIATLKLFKGKGDILINGLEVNKYFNHPSFIQTVQTPLVITDNMDKYYFEAKVNGGGKVGQSHAIKLALARALDKLNTQDYHSLLKKANLLTVDSRNRQRRQVGTGGKARRQKQSPKR